MDYTKYISTLCDPAVYLTRRARTYIKLSQINVGVGFKMGLTE